MCRNKSLAWNHLLTEKFELFCWNFSALIRCCTQAYDWNTKLEQIIKIALALYLFSYSVVKLNFMLVAHARTLWKCHNVYANISRRSLWILPLTLTSSLCFACMSSLDQVVLPHDVCHNQCTNKFRWCIFAINTICVVALVQRNIHFLNVMWQFHWRKFLPSVVNACMYLPTLIDTIFRTDFVGITRNCFPDLFRT